MRFEFPFKLIGKSTTAFLTGQSRRVLKSWDTGGDPEQGFCRCYADGLNLRFNSVCGAGYCCSNLVKEIPGETLPAERVGLFLGGAKL